MVDAWLIIVTVVVGVLMLGINIYTFVLYCHPDDLSSGAGWFSKIIVLLGSAVIWAFVLTLPLDVANSRGDGGGFNMGLFYQIMFILYFVFLVFLLPLTLFIYESDDEKPFISRFCYAFFMELFTLIIVAVLAFIAWGALRTAQLSDLKVQPPSAFVGSETALAASAANATVFNGRVTYNVPPFIFVIVFLVFIGWFVLVIFLGVGITALPLDWIIDFFYRPKPRSAREMAERKVALRRRTEELLEFARNIQEKVDDVEEHGGERGVFSRWRENRFIGQKDKKLTSEVYKLEEEFEIWEVENNLSANPLWSILKLALGIIFGMISLLIWLHVIFNVLIRPNGRPLSPFLNKLFTWMEFSIARFISTIFFAGLCIYLLFCVIKGNIKFGLRLFFLIKIHPMKQGRTYMNSFLFNTMMILLCTPPVMHFVIVMFQSYMNLTSGVFLFSVLIQRMKFFKWFFNTRFFFYAFIAWSVITFFYLIIKPKSDRMNIKKIIERRRKI